MVERHHLHINTAQGHLIRTEFIDRHTTQHFVHLDQKVRTLHLFAQNPLKIPLRPLMSIDSDIVLRPISRGKNSSVRDPTTKCTERQKVDQTSQATKFTQDQRLFAIKKNTHRHFGKDEDHRLLDQPPHE
ncbi:MAG: hypothetical protein M2R45_00810 [Verrucomicrobia subdivision 3 bacterium]|nr:hypothetical protein [Limisphaerales bacterium]MCS1413084.1 hypothetical protein [Limisphaerales bacterium]